MPDITVKQQQRVIEKYSLEKDVITIGREEENDIVLKGTGISRVHAMIFGSLAGYTIEDNNSTNGLLVNGESYAVKALGDRDTITIGDFDLIFRRWATGAGKKTDSGEVRPLTDSGRRLDVHTIAKDWSAASCSLRVIKGKHRGQAIVLKKGRTSIGRAKDCDIRLGGLFAPARHAVITLRGPVFILEHVGWGAAIYVNGEPVSRHVLQSGDEIRFGSKMTAVFEF